MFNPTKVPVDDSSDLFAYGEDSVDLLLAHCGVEQPAERVDGDKYAKEALTSPEIWMEWKCFEATYLSSQKELCIRS